MDLSIELFAQLAYATGIGLLIGLERSIAVGARPAEETTDLEEDAEASPDEGPTRHMGERMGVRTFAILAVIGFMGALLGDIHPIMAPLTLLCVSGLVVAMYLRAEAFGVGITTEAAAIGACGLGMLSHSHMHAAGVLGLVLTVLLSSKRFTHAMILKMRRVELTDTLKFLVIILILLPIVPNRALDPYGAFNPYKVTFLVILISGIGYVGYFLTRILGAQRGLGLTGLVGGLTSSTAVTAAMAAQAKGNPALRWICAFATVGANATMFVRVLVVVAVLDQGLAMTLAWSIGTMAGVAFVASVVLWFVAAKKADGSEASNKVPLKNPFSLGPALKFAAFFVLILVVAKLAKMHFGDQGLYLASAVSGLADVDAITLTIAEQAKGGTLALNVGAIGITIAVVANSIVKSGIALYSGGWRFGWIVATALIVSTGAGLAVSLIV